jgi:predicted nucleic acid-binding protein
MNRDEYKSKVAEQRLNRATLSEAVLFIHNTIKATVGKEVDKMDDKQFKAAAKKFAEEAGKSDK